MRSPRRSPAFNTLLILGILVVFVALGVWIWFDWSADAATAADNGSSGAAWPWALAVIGGPVLLALVLAVARLRARKTDTSSDPHTPADDPSKGMTGHGR